MTMTDYTLKEHASLDPPFHTSVLGEQPLLPATYRTRRHKVRLVSADTRSFLESDLDVQRLSAVHRHLWLCGLPGSPRPLHYQNLKGRAIVVSEQLDLHLVWSPSRIFIKPLPRYLLSTDFWRAQICPFPHLYRTALGFILSHVALVEREVDFNIALNSGLLPKELTWPAWLAVCEQVMAASAHSKAYLSESADSSHPHVAVDPRFFYGELRVGRLNWIYRIALGHPRGYFSGCTTYGAFVRDNINSLISLFAYITIVLSAMQVGLATPSLSGNAAFGRASYVFSIFAIVAPLSALAAILAVLALVFTFNLLRTLAIQRRRKSQGAGV